jgi:hypothetical protein
MASVVLRISSTPRWKNRAIFFRVSLPFGDPPSFLPAGHGSRPSFGGRSALWWSFGTAVSEAGPLPPRPSFFGDEGVRQGSPVGPIASGSGIATPLVQIALPLPEEEEESSQSTDPATPGSSSHPSAGRTPAGGRPSAYPLTGEAEVAAHFLTTCTQVLEALNVRQVHPEVRDDINRLGNVAIIWSQGPPSSAVGGTAIHRRRQHYPAPFDIAAATANGTTAGLRARMVACNTALVPLQALGDAIPLELRWEIHRVKAAYRTHCDRVRHGRGGRRGRRQQASAVQSLST